MITGPVHDLVSGLVSVEPLDALLVDGPGPPVRLYRAMSTGPSSGRGFAAR
jgi:hypothetical protein